MQYRQDGRLKPAQRVSGSGAAALKYDILTALLVTAAQGQGAEARLALRLSLVVTARYNWQQGQFSVGLKELARLWGVTERTAKREMAQMRALGWIAVERPAARGRVACHRLEIAAVLADSAPLWPAVGPDYVARMTAAPDPDEAPASNVVPLHRAAGGAGEGDPLWQAVCARLMDQDRDVYRAWFAPLTVAERDEDGLTLSAPSGFVAGYVRTHYMARLSAAVAAETGRPSEVRVIHRV